MFFMLYKGSLIYDKPEMLFGILFYFKGYYKERNLPSNGIHKFLYSIACTPHARVQYKDLYTDSYEKSGLIFIVNRFKKIYEFVNNNLKNEKSENLFDFLTSMTNVIIFWGKHIQLHPDCKFYIY